MTAHRTWVKYRNRASWGMCACGWRGPKRPVRSEATNDAQMHKLERRYGS